MVTNAQKYVNELIYDAEREYSLRGDRNDRIFLHNFPMFSDYVFYILNKELEKVTDKNIENLLKKEVYGFEHIEARTFAINHPDSTEDECFTDLVENGELTEEEAKKFVDELRTYRNF